MFRGLAVAHRIIDLWKVYDNEHRQNTSLRGHTQTSVIIFVSGLLNVLSRFPNMNRNNHRLTRCDLGGAKLARCLLGHD